MECGLVAKRSCWMALVMLVLVTGAFATISLPDDGGEVGYDGGSILKPCCDKCGSTCTRREPFRCVCEDVWKFICPPWCKNCVDITYPLRPSSYQCMDFISKEYCDTPCTPKLTTNK